VFSVTSEAAANASFQAAQPKPARPDRSAHNDNFGALLDSNLSADPSVDASPAVQQPSASQRRADDAAASGDEARSRETSNTRSRGGSADKPARNNPDDRDSSAKQASDPKGAGDAGINADTDQRTRTKFGQSKHGSAQPTEKQSSEKSPAVDPAASTPGDDLAAVTTTAAVAVPIPVLIALADVPAVTSTTGSAAASPATAIATAGVAADATAASAPVFPPEQTNIISDAKAAAAPDSTLAAPDSAPVVVPANAAIVDSSDKAVHVEAAGQSIAPPIKQAAAPIDAAPLADVAFTAAAAITAAAAAVPKAAAPKSPIAATAKVAAPGTADTKLDTSDRSPASTDLLPAQPKLEQPAAAKPESGTDNHERAASEGAAAKPSVSVDPAPAPVHDHSLLASAAHPLTDSPEASTQATGAIQPALPIVPAAAAPAASLSVAAGNPLVPLSGLAFEIAASARSGKSSFEIRLDPADLGRVDVRIDVDRTGQVTSHLRVEKPETLSMLRQDAPQLQRALDDAGFKTGDGGLQFSLRDQSSSGNNSGNETSRNAQRLVIADDETIPAAIAGRSYGRVLGSTSGVDIRV
jgi:flagellar hook-length control protein FliK